MRPLRAVWRPLPGSVADGCEDEAVAIAITTGVKAVDRRGISRNAPPKRLKDEYEPETAWSRRNSERAQRRSRGTGVGRQPARARRRRACARHETSRFRCDAGQRGPRYVRARLELLRRLRGAGVATIDSEPDSHVDHETDHERHQHLAGSDRADDDGRDRRAPVEEIGSGPIRRRPVRVDEGVQRRRDGRERGEGSVDRVAQVFDCEAEVAPVDHPPHQAREAHDRRETRPPCHRTDQHTRGSGRISRGRR
jgi:hypothetical protein